MQAGWSGSGPQIRGPGPVTQWALARVCSYDLLQTANHRHKSLPGAKTVLTDILPQTYPPTAGKSSKAQGVASPPPASCSLQERAGPPLGLPTSLRPCSPHPPHLALGSAFHQHRPSSLLVCSKSSPPGSLPEPLALCVALACPSPLLTEGTLLSKRPGSLGNGHALCLFLFI